MIVTLIRTRLHDSSCRAVPRRAVECIKISTARVIPRPPSHRYEHPILPIHPTRNPNQRQSPEHYSTNTHIHPLIMVSTLEKRIMVQKLSAKCTSPKSCKLCHGPLTTSNPNSPPIRASGPQGEVDCHPSCLPFACPGCVNKNRANYGMTNLGGSYSHCALCVSEDQDVGEGWGGKVTVIASH